MARAPFIWQEVEHWTLPDIVETLRLIEEQDEADDFMESYAAACVDEDHALHNVGYIADLLMSDDDDEDAQEDGERIMKLFDVERKITPLQVFKGSSLGRKSEKPETEKVPV